MNQVALVNAIEQLIDDTCADSVKDAFAAVCAEKAAHIRASYGEDDTDADAWDALADAVNRVPNFGV